MAATPHSLIHMYRMLMRHELGETIFPDRVWLFVKQMLRELVDYYGEDETKFLSAKSQSVLARGFEALFTFIPLSTTPKREVCKAAIDRFKMAVLNYVEERMEHDSGEAKVVPATVAGGAETDSAAVAVAVAVSVSADAPQPKMTPKEAAGFHTVDNQGMWLVNCKELGELVKLLDDVFVHAERVDLWTFNVFIHIVDRAITRTARRKRRAEEMAGTGTGTGTGTGEEAAEQEAAPEGPPETRSRTA